MRGGCHRDVLMARWSFAGYRFPLGFFFVHTYTYAYNYIGFRSRIRISTRRRHTAGGEIDKIMCDNAISSLLLLLGKGRGEAKGKGKGKGRSGLRGLEEAKRQKGLLITNK